MKIKISKSQWEEMGTKAGWVKLADWERPADVKDIDFTSIYKKLVNKVESSIRNLHGIMDVNIQWRNPHSAVIKFSGYSKSDFETSGLLLVSFMGAKTAVSLFGKTVYGESTLMDNVETEGSLPLKSIVYNIWGIFQ